MARPKLHDENLRQRLLEAATELVAEKGDTFALRPLAESLDTSTTAIYSLFGSRTALLEAVAENAVSSFAEALSSVRHDDPLIWMLQLAMGYRSWAQASPSRFHIISDAKVDTEDVRAARARTTEPLYEAAQAAIDQGYLEGELDDICTLLFAGVHGYIVLELSGGIAGGDEGFYTYIDSLFLAHATERGRAHVIEHPALELTQQIPVTELV